ncbi:MAG: 30S ribosomal protein S16 [bacterium]
MVILRLSRHGRKNQPSFRIVVQEKQRSPSSNVLETIGRYDPRTNPAAFDVKADRVAHWISHGAQVSNTLHNLFVEHKILSGEKRRVVHLKKQPEEKIASTPEAAPAKT